MRRDQLDLDIPLFMVREAPKVEIRTSDGSCNVEGCANGDYEVKEVWEHFDHLRYAYESEELD